MDSGGNSGGSMQSSSGGDEDSYDSRAGVSTDHHHQPSSNFSAFLNPSNHHHHVGGLMPNPPPPSHPNNNNSSMFDPFSNYFDPLSSRSSLTTNPNSLLNLDMVWSKNLRSELNSTDLGGLNFMAAGSSSSSSSTQQQQLLPDQTLQNRTTFATFPVAAAAAMHNNNNNITQAQGVISTGLVSPSSVSGTNMEQNTNSNTTVVARNPKKRSRASRRAPTTVLTTDTTNFRAMVQEFTGIPAPPFTSSSFPRTRLDLFGRSSTSNHIDPPPYLLRPFPQKLNSSSMVDAITIPSIATTTTNNIMSSSATNNNNNSSNSTSINYQLPQNLLTMNMQQQNPILNLQSLLQGGGSSSPSKYTPQGSLPIPSSNDTSPSHHHRLKIGVLDDLGLSHTSTGHLSGHQNSVRASLPIRDHHHHHHSTTPPTNWSASTGGVVNTNGNDKANNFSVSTSSSDFHGDKGPENVVAATARTDHQGNMLESWICSSD